MLGKLRNMTAIYLFKKDKVLLLFKQGGRVVSNVWTGSAGGHFEEYELNDAKACVLRELNEELNLNEDNLSNFALRYITLRMTNGEIRQNYYFFAELKDEIDEELTSNEGSLKWFSIDELDDLPMPHTAKYVIKHYCLIGQHTKEIYTGITDEEKVTFIELYES